jgi:hypothetical protein
MHPQTRKHIVLTSRDAKPAGSQWKLAVTMLYDLPVWANSFIHEHEDTRSSANSGAR